MNANDEYVLIAPCGLSCGHCPAYLSKDNPAPMKDLIVRLSKENPAITEDLVTWSANRDTISCPGCRKRSRGEVAEDTRKHPMTSLLTAVRGDAQPTPAPLNMGWIFAMNVRNFLASNYSRAQTWPM